MVSMKALIIKEFRELSRDRRTLAMLIVLPTILLVVFGYAANFTVEQVSTVIVGKHAQQSPKPSASWHGQTKRAAK